MNITQHQRCRAHALGDPYMILLTHITISCSLTASDVFLTLREKKRIVFWGFFSVLCLRVTVMGANSCHSRFARGVVAPLRQGKRFALI